jgi:hypothetical protein
MLDQTKPKTWNSYFLGNSYTINNWPLIAAKNLVNLAPTWLHLCMNYTCAPLTCIHACGWALVQITEVYLAN